MKLNDCELVNSTTELFDKKYVFPFISIIYPIWITIYDLKNFMLQLVLKIYVFAKKTTDLIIMATRFNFLVMRMKKQGSKCVLNFSLLKKILGKHFNVFHKFPGTADKFIELFSV